MSSGVRVILGHVLSTAGKPKHEDCPKGSTSQSSYQRDIANRIQEHWLIKNSLTPAIVEKVEPVFETFGDKQFLAAVEKCYTTNANESFHHVVWSMCPKEQYNSPKGFSVALNLLVGIFNDCVRKTHTSSYKMLNPPFTENMNESLLKIYKDRIIKSDYRSKLTICQKGCLKKTRK